MRKCLGIRSAVSHLLDERTNQQTYRKQQESHRNPKKIMKGHTKRRWLQGEKKCWNNKRIKKKKFSVLLMGRQKKHPLRASGCQRGKCSSVLRVSLSLGVLSCAAQWKNRAGGLQVIRHGKENTTSLNITQQGWTNKFQQHYEQQQHCEHWPISGAAKEKILIFSGITTRLMQTHSKNQETMYYSAITTQSADHKSAS